MPFHTPERPAKPNFSVMSDVHLLRLWFAEQTILHAVRFASPSEEDLIHASEAEIVDIEVEMNRRGFRA